MPHPDLYNLRRRAWSQGYTLGTEHTEKNQIDIPFALAISRNHGAVAADFISGYASSVSDACRKGAQA